MSCMSVVSCKSEVSCNSVVNWESEVSCKDLVILRVDFLRGKGMVT